MIYGLPVKYRAWWDTKLSRSWPITPWLALFWAHHFAPLPHDIPANDRDHLRW